MKTIISCAILLAAVTASAQVAIEIVLDTSESMLRPVGKSNLFEGTAAAILTVVSEAEDHDEELAIGLRVAAGGGDEGDQCSAARTVTSSGAPDRELWAEALSAIKPAGPRPLNASVAAAIDDLSVQEGPVRIVIITSGADGCDSSPELVAAALTSADRPVDLRLVGLDLDPSTIEGFGKIALENAIDADELLAALRWAILDTGPPASAETPPPDPTPSAPPATVDAPPQLTAGETFDVTWSGPDGDEDFLSLAPKAFPDDDYTAWARTNDGSPLTLRAPGVAGFYEVRYVDGESGEALARVQIEVVPISIVVQAPATVRAGLRFEVLWTGPATPGDFLSIAKPDWPPQHHRDWASTTMGSPLTLAAPTGPGAYEVRYVTGDGREILALTTIEVQP